jgi:hypothetical protein
LKVVVQAFIPNNLEPSAHDNQLHYSAPAPIDGAHRRVGQTFVANADNLAAIAVFVRSPGSQPSHTLEFRLFHEGDQSPIVNHVINLTGVKPGDFLTINFTPIRASKGQRFMFELTGDAVSDRDPVILGATDWDSYTGGYALADGERQPGDLSFTAYSSPTMLELLWRGVISLSTRGAAIATLLAAVLALSSVTWHFVQPSDGSSPALAAAVICASPLLAAVYLLVSSAAGLRFNPFLIIGVGAALGLWRAVRNRSWLPRCEHPAEWISLLGSALFILVMQSSLIADQAMPAYVDSVHHVAITKAITMSGMLPDTMPAQGSTATFFYHFGTHALSTSITMLSGGAISPGEALLAEGPVLLLLYALGVYALLRMIGVGHWPGMAAMLLSTFAFSMPTYLLTWGRYPLLLALATAGGVVSLLIHASKAGARTQTRVIVGLLIAGSMLAHTRMAFIWLIVACAGALFTWRANPAPRKVLAQLAPIWITALIVMLVWLAPRWVTSTATPKSVPTTVNIPAGTGQRELATLIDPHDLIEPIWIGILLVGTLGLIRQPGSPTRLGMIAILLTLRVLPLLRFPGLVSGAVFDSAFSSAAISFIVTAALGTVVGDAQKILELRWQAPAWSAALVAGVMLAAGLSARPTAPSLCCELATASDVEAWHWISSSVPATATIGIAVAQWPDNVAVGLDGGYWINEMTGRLTTLPNMLVLYEKRGGQWQIIRERALAVDTMLRFHGDEVCTLDIDYVYMGGTGGSFEPPVLESNPHLRVVYRNERTALFQVIGCAVP